MQDLSLTNSFIKLIIVLGTIVATPLFILLGIVMFPLFIYYLIGEWCKGNLTEEEYIEEEEHYGWD